MNLATRAVGVSFVPGYPGNLLDLIARLEHGEDLVVDLVRDLDNAHDFNATGIYLEGRRLGSLAADFASFVAPQLDAGRTWRARIRFVAVDLDHRDRPGLVLELRRED